MSLYNYKWKLDFFEGNVHWNWIQRCLSLKKSIYNDIFKGHVKIVKIYIVKFNVTNLYKPKIMNFHKKGKFT